MKPNILSTIGNTPIVLLSRLFSPDKLSVFAKLEGLNPGGSMKDRVALKILDQAISNGIVTASTVIVESSSGNLGIGLAQACRYYELRFICVVDAKLTVQNLRILRAYGAEIDFIQQPDPVTGEFLKARIDRVQALLKTVKNSIWLNQYENLENPRSHYQTMHEIVLAVGGNLDYLFCATSTCGTLRGCAEYLRDHRLKTRVIAVDAVGSNIFGSRPAKRLLPGHGASIRPPLLQDNLASKVVHVDDLECVIGCRRLVHHEAILAGGSSGAVISAVERCRDGMAPGSRCAVILPDRGERYLDTVYSDEWVTSHFGDVEHMWK